METTSINTKSEGLKLLGQTDEDKTEALRFLFRNKYVQTETAFLSSRPAPSVPGSPEA
ncbi:MAG TPA: hypothetical protein PKI32_00080 [Opitutales bacterium]|nr:hypothetical protein [Opitutales bacterium]